MFRAQGNFCSMFVEAEPRLIQRSKANSVSKTSQ